MVVMVVMVVVVIVANDDKVLAMPANIIDAGHGERDIARMRESHVSLQLKLFSVDAERLLLRTPYRRAVQVENAESLEARKRGSVFVLYFRSRPHNVRDVKRKERIAK